MPRTLVVLGGGRFHLSEVPLYPPRDISLPPYPPRPFHAPPVPQRRGFVFRGGPIYSEAGLSPELYDAERSMVPRERHHPYAPTVGA